MESLLSQAISETENAYKASLEEKEQIDPAANEAPNLKSLEEFPSLSSSSTQANGSTAWHNAPSKIALLHSFSQVIQLPFDQQKVVNERGEKISYPLVLSAIMKRTGCEIEMSTSKATKSISFAISGKQKNVLLAKKELVASLFKPYSISFPVAAEYRGLILGPGGKTLSGICTATSTRIKVPNKDEGDDACVVIVGDEEGVKEAHEMITNLVQERASKCVEKISIDRKYLPFLFGFSNEKLKSLENFKNFLHFVDENVAELTLSGDKIEISAFLDSINKQINILSKSLKVVSIPVKKSLHKLLVGPKGCFLAQIFDETGCVVRVPKQDDPSDSICVHGNDANLLKGLALIMEKSNSQIIESLVVNEEIRRILLATRMSFIKDLESKYSIQVHFTTAGIEVSGEKDSSAEVDATLRELQSKLDEIKKLFVEAISVDPDFHGFVVGKKGQNIAKYHKEFNVEVIVPHEGRGSILLVSSNQQDLLKVKEQILKEVALRSEYVSLAVHAEKKFHSKLKRFINDFKASHEHLIIKVPKEEEEEEEIVIKGSPSTVKAVHADLIKLIEEIKHDSIMNSYTIEFKLPDSHVKYAKREMYPTSKEFQIKCFLEQDTVKMIGLKRSVEDAKKSLLEQLHVAANTITAELSIDPKYYSKLIGKGGKNLKSLKERYSVKITFPSDLDDGGEGEVNDKVTIKGLAKNVEAAKKELLELLDYEIAHSKQVTIQCAKKISYSLVGKKSANSFDALSDEYSVHIDMIPVDKLHCQITIEGEAENIQKVAAILQRVIADLESIKRETIKADEKFRSFFKGRRSKEMATDHSVQIYTKDMIEIVGDGSAVDACKAKIEALMQSFSAFSSVEIKIPKDMKGMMIGPSGQTIKALEKDYEISIEFIDCPEDDVVCVCIAGQPESCKTARQVILDKLSHTLPIKCSLPIQQSIIADAALKLKIEHLQCSIKPDASRGLKIHGLKSNVYKAAGIINSAIESMQLMVESVKVPVSLHSKIIGKGGKTIKDLEKEFACEIFVPKGGASDQIELRGMSAERLKELKDRIESLINK